ncbi:unnamed protein product [Angiostrongylus costaricensis]|uniref:Uncharacterized protein n=1 Tax=Angiostrongylus costaricensis TaxID=334426 RepID=A0A0R3PLL4_ANGCS|nr:unnamed protein product [Angiostrongylus costaricensis]
MADISRVHSLSLHQSGALRRRCGLSAVTQCSGTRSSARIEPVVAASSAITIVTGYWIDDTVHLTHSWMP